jgi:hypothetical protein
MNLAAAPHALAREYGFDSWPKLVDHVEIEHPANRMQIATFLMRCTAHARRVIFAPH